MDKRREKRTDEDCENMSLKELFHEAYLRTYEKVAAMSGATIPPGRYQIDNPKRQDKSPPFYTKIINYFRRDSQR